jgi:GT2 family glycosyltransferase
MKSEKPSVSVIVPNLNQGHFLEQALQSIISQSDLDIRIAVMDAGSSDGSLAIIKNYEMHLTYWRSHPDNGQAAAINEGMQKLPPSDYVCWLNADDVFLENGLTEMVEYLEEHRSCVSVYSKAYITDVNNDILCEYPTEKFSINGLARQCFICQPATLIRSNAWLEVDGVDPAYHMCMDYDLWWRLHKKGEIGYLDHFTACSRDHEGTKTRNNKEKHFQETFKLLKTHFGFVPFHWCVSMIRETKLNKNMLFPRVLSNLIGAYVYVVNRI